MVTLILHELAHVKVLDTIPPLGKTMQICNDGHLGIVFNCDFCPLCKALNEVEALKKEREGLNDYINELQNRIGEGK